MKSHYDFSKGERGKFCQPNAVFRRPVYLDEQVQNYLVHQSLGLPRLMGRHAPVACKHDRIQPKRALPIGAANVNMRGLSAIVGVEVETKN